MCKCAGACVVCLYFLPGNPSIFINSGASLLHGLVRVQFRAALTAKHLKPSGENTMIG